MLSGDPILRAIATQVEVAEEAKGRRVKSLGSMNNEEEELLALDREQLFHDTDDTKRPLSRAS